MSGPVVPGRIAYRVPDIEWPAHAGGLQLTLPPNVLLEVGQMVVVFDRNYQMTRHRVVLGEFMRATLGPAERWPGRFTRVRPAPPDAPVPS